MPVGASDRMKTHALAAVLSTDRAGSPLDTCCSLRRADCSSTKDLLEADGRCSVREVRAVAASTASGIHSTDCEKSATREPIRRIALQREPARRMDGPQAYYEPCYRKLSTSIRLVSL